MATLVEELQTTLEDDATLTAILSGGVHLAREVQQISRQATPEAFDANSEVKPCALVRVEGITPFGPFMHSGRIYVSVWLYERAGYASIDAAQRRIYELLHKQRLTATDATVFELTHGGDLGEQEDQALNCALTVCRYVATVHRVATEPVVPPQPGSAALDFSVASNSMYTGLL